MTTRFNMSAAVLLLAIGLPGWWLFYDNRPGDVAAKPLDIAGLRTLASAIPGPRPTAITGYMVAYGNLEGTLLAGGQGFKNLSLGEISWQVAYPASGPVVIGTGFAPGAIMTGAMKVHNSEVQAEVARSLPAARAILAVAPTPGQLGGLAAASTPTVAARARLQAGQEPGSPAAATVPWRSSVRLSATLTGSGPQAVAPGIVAIPTPGFGPGTQMVYAQLADGREFLFAGEVAPLAASWRKLRARPRLMTDHLAPQDRDEAFAWLKAIARLQRQAPAMRIVPGYDLEWIGNREEGPRLPVRPLTDTQLPAGK